MIVTPSDEDLDQHPSLAPLQGVWPVYNGTKTTL